LAKQSHEEFPGKWSEKRQQQQYREVDSMNLHKLRRLYMEGTHGHLRLGQVAKSKWFQRI
jgi:hypothetical protein